MSNRPLFETFNSGVEFKQWYWLKEELVDLCKKAQITYSGNKAELTERLSNLIDEPEGVVVKPKKSKARSKFNWSKETLTCDTIITDSYANGPNVRQFFKKHLGENFKFNIAFMQWMKDHQGETLADAVEAYKTIKTQAKTKESIIPSSNQYNQYMRDFFKDNPDKGIADARHYWKLKRSLPVKPIYERSDLLLK